MPKFSDERIRAIIAGRRCIGRFPFPGGDLEIGVRLLTDREIDTARFNAQHYLKNRCERAHLDLEAFVRIDPESLDREHIRQILFWALVDPESEPDNPARFFGDDEEVRRLDSVLVQQLWEIYMGWQDSINPRAKLTKEESDELLATIKKEPEKKAVLAALERDTLVNLLIILVSQPQTSPNIKSSTLQS